MYTKRADYRKTKREPLHKGTENRETQFNPPYSRNIYRSIFTLFEGRKGSEIGFTKNTVKYSVSINVGDDYETCHCNSTRIINNGL